MSVRNDSVQYDVVAVAGSSNITPLSNIYYFAAQNPIAYTYNLPPITCDGMKFKVVRTDKLVAATLTISAVNNINYAGVISTSVNLDIYSIAIFISFNSVWYFVIVKPQTLIPNKIIFSGNYTSPSSLYRTFTRAGTANLFMGAFRYNGSLTEVITGGTFFVRRVSSGSPSFEIFLTSSTSPSVIATTGVYSLTVVRKLLSFTTVNQSLLPLNESILTLYVYINNTGTSTELGVSSFIIY